MSNESKTNKSRSKKEQITEEFKKIVIDLMDDILITFPEYKEKISEWWLDDIKNYEKVFKHCQKEYPPYFFDILYKNKEAFESSNFEIVPNIKLNSLLFAENISDHTFEIIWKYLQLLLFSIINTIKDKNAFGDATKNLFSAISPETMQEKLEEVMEGFKEIFQNTEDNDQDFEGKTENNTQPDLSNNFIPDLDEIQEHLKELMDGKIGQFAMEMAEDWIQEFGMDMNLDMNTENMNSTTTEMFEKILKDPSKMMKLMQNVFNKFQDKINSGELTQEEIIKESKIMLEKLKGIKIPGMEKMMSLLSLLTQKKRNKESAAAAYSNFSHIQKSMEYEKMKEKLLASKNKLNNQKMEKEKRRDNNKKMNENKPSFSDEDLIKMFENSQRKSTSSNKNNTKNK